MLKNYALIALRTLRRRLGPELEGLIEQGRVHYQQEELQSALDDWRRALLIDPGNGQEESRPPKTGWCAGPERKMRFDDQ